MNLLHSEVAILLGATFGNSICRIPAQFPDFSSLQNILLIPMRQSFSIVCLCP